MRMLPLTEVKVGDILAYTLRGPDRRVILREGTAIADSHLRYLHNHGYTSIPVHFTGYEGIDPDPWISEQLIARIVQRLKTLPGVFDRKTLHDVEGLVDEMLAEMATHARGALQLLTSTEINLPPVLLALNRALIVARVGRTVFDETTLTRVMAAALLADSGADNALETGHVTDEDEPIRRAERVERTVSYLQTGTGVAPRTIASIQQMYAHWDGSGVPALARSAIFVGASLLGPADRLSRLLLDVPERPALPPHEALEWMMGGADSEFSLEWLSRIQQDVAPYGVGSTVRLSDGQLAVVVHAPVGQPQRPTVRLLTGGRRGLEMALTDRAYRNIAIVDVYRSRDLDVSA
jgi:hypothetical protein